MKRVTLKEIAKVAGVSRTTVSLALQNHPRIPAATRERMQTLAKEMDYTPDPVLGRLNAYSTKQIETTPKAAIAWINFWREPKALYKNETFNQFFEGARTKAKDLGYVVEEMVLHSKQMSIRRIENILLNRNITGLLIPPAENADAVSINLHWERYTTVKFGYTMTGIDSRLVTNTQFETARLATAKAAEKGFSRVGIFFEKHMKKVTTNNFLGGYLVEQLNHPFLVSIPALITTQSDRAPEKEVFLKWYEQHRPQCILVQNSAPLKWLLSAGVRIPQDVSLHHLALPCKSEFNYTGVDQNSFKIGQEAVAWLDRLMRHGELGPPMSHHENLVGGDWVEGETG